MEEEQRKWGIRDRFIFYSPLGLIIVGALMSIFSDDLGFLRAGGVEATPEAITAHQNSVEMLGRSFAGLGILSQLAMLIALDIGLNQGRPR